MKNKIILAVGAHPDDMDFGASGTIAKWVSEGATAYYLICTDGSRGSEDPKMTHKKLAATRKEEQLEAAKVLGVKKVFFLNHTDTQLVSDLKLKEQIVRIIRIVRPDTVITMDPTFYYSTDFFNGFGFINHTDHRAAALATMDACFPLCRDRLTFPEHEKVGLRSRKVKEVLFTNFEKKDFIVDISKTFDRKIKALSLHKSQFSNFKEVEDRVKKRAKLLGKSKGYKFAENFVKITLA
ncbi:MAG: PIG-L deacetylase family protein [Candidatus Levybacteria bacterium]|nr:PIG-L deacetylase family protein [Candidatus Levybacteria bacterium]